MRKKMKIIYSITILSLYLCLSAIGPINISCDTSTLTIITPEEKIYEEIPPGCFFGTYGFEDTPAGEIPNGWYADAPYGYIQVVEELDEHRHVVDVHKYNTGSDKTRIHRVFESQMGTLGSVEFWLRKDTNSGNDGTNIFLYADMTNSTKGYIALAIANGQLGYGFGTQMSHTTWVATNVFNQNVWYHVRVDINATKGWQITIDNTTVYGNGYAYPFETLISNQITHLSSIDTISGFGLQSYYAGDNPSYSTYLDALGFSWDPYYEVGDNTNEGLLLSFTNTTSLDWMGYSLDGQANRTISGNTTLPQLVNGTHQVQVFGNDSIGEEYQSQVQFFTIGDAPIISRPKDFSIYEGSTGYTILWTVSGKNPANYTIYRNDSYFDNGSWIDSIIAPLDELAVGKHNFTVYANVTNGNFAKDEVWITILPSLPDITPPAISSPADIAFEEGSIGYSITWEGSDENPWWAIVLTNKTFVAYNDSWIGNNITVGLSELLVGTFEYNCTLFDEAGNPVSDIVIVTVTEQVPDENPPSIDAPSTFEMHEGTVGNNITWVCFDDHPYAFSIVINETEIDYGPWHGENITQFFDDLTLGTWIVNLTLWDLSQNNETKTISVVVLPPEPDISPPLISQPAELRVIENMTGVIIWEVSDENPDKYCIYKNGSLILSSDHWVSGIIQYTFTNLTLGTWEFNLTLWDKVELSSSSMAIVRVLNITEIDQSSPEIAHIDDKTVIHGTSGNTLEFRLFDQHPRAYSIYVNGTEVINHTWLSPNIKVIFSLDQLSIGSYNITLTAWDIFDHKVSGKVTVSVIGDDTPPVISSPPDVILSKGVNGTITWEVSEENPARYEIILVTTGEILENESWSGTDIVLDLSKFEVGDYQIRCIIYDLAGNFAFDDVNITIQQRGQTTPGFELVLVFPILVMIFIFKIKTCIARNRRNAP